MNDTASGLQRYAGRYLIDWGWHEGKDVSRYMDVSIADGQLTVETETVSYPIAPGKLPADHPLVERRKGRVHGLTPVGEHSFDAIDYPGSYRFVLDDDGVAESVIVTRGDESSQPCPKYVPLPGEIPGRRERADWFDLGHATICMMAKDLDALGVFYERIGFTRHPKAPANIRHGWTVVAFLGFQQQPCINYRGTSIVETAFELARRGYVLADGRLETTCVRGDGSGGFMLYDPDGHRMFFNTHPPERPAYEAWKRGELPEAKAAEGWNVGASAKQNLTQAPVSLPLGELVASIDVRDLQVSIDFYHGVGFEIVERTSDYAVVSHFILQTIHRFIPPQCGGDFSH